MPKVGRQWLMEHIAMERKRKTEQFHRLNQLAATGQIVMAGSSLMENFPITEMAQVYHLPLAIYNRAISGDTIDDQLERMDTTFWELEPSKVFINIGTNDISAPDYNREIMLEKYAHLLSLLKERLPDTMVYVLAYYPVNRTLKIDPELFGARTNEELEAVNAQLPGLASRFGYEFIDVFTPLRGPDGNLPAELTYDGMHMYPAGYLPVLKILLPYLR